MTLSATGAFILSSEANLDNSEAYLISKRAVLNQTTLFDYYGVVRANLHRIISLKFLYSVRVLQVYNDNLFHW